MTTTRIFKIQWRGGCRGVNKTRYAAGKSVLLGDSEIDRFIIDGLRNELRKIGANENNMNKKELCDTLQKDVKDKVPNVTAEEINIKVLSGFPHTEKWCTIKPDVSQ